VPYEAFDVRVAGGTLRVGRWGSGPAVVVAVHGITGNHLSWQAVARELGDAVTLLAPDLRGRAGSASLAGPYGMAVHADDLFAVLDHLGLERAVLAGHSMGGFVVTVAAVRQPDRVRGVVLVDGGLPLPLPAGVDGAAVIGPARARLDMTFASRDEYRAFWRAHPAFADAWNDDVEAFVDYDLVGEPPACRSSVSLDAVLGDTEDMFMRSEVRNAVTRLPCAAMTLRAERGLLNEVPALYPDDAIVPQRAAWPMVRDDVVVADTNHYTIALSPHGAKVVAEQIRALAVGDER
jgi:pimeloyl-ACP methyl ester carboxylesterase